MNPTPSESPPPPSAATLAGTVVAGRYQVERLLGSGGMSAVYLARQLQLDRRCALKVLLPGRAAHPDAAARFAREAMLASRIAHPNLCHVYDSGCTPEGLAWLAMEYLEGESLATALARGPLSAPRALAITLGCAAGLAAAHAGGIIHRDLKPANVMLVQRNGVETPVVFDFGIAWSPEGEGLTRDGMMVGTPEVMSPEQIAGDPVDARSDQYQLALLACRMLTGKLPFLGETTQETMLLRLTEDPAPLEQLLPGVTVGPALQATITRALARRPADRFPDVAAFAEAVSASGTAAGEPPTELLPRSGATLAPRHPASRHPMRRLLGAAILLALVWVGWAQPWRQVAGGEPSTPPAAVPPAPAPPPTTPPPSPPAAAPSPPGSAPGTALPELPTDEAVFSTDSAVRRQARQQAEKVYRSVEVPDTTRALAAYMVADVFRREGLYASARQWLEQCLTFGERKLCRDLLNALP